MHVVVTGGAGFIGSHVVDRLVGTGAEVTVVDDLSTGQRLRLDGAAPSGALTFVEADCTDVACADLLAQARPDVVCHLAAQIDVRASVAEPVYDVERNVLATLRVLESCRAAGVGRFVFASSGGAMYGDAEGRPTDETAPLRPSSPYGAAKAAVEMYLSAYRASYGLESVSLALGNVYGERQRVPVPTHAQPNTGSDHAMVVVDAAAGKSCEFWQARKDNPGWATSWGEIVSLAGSGTGGATGSGVSRLAGVVRTSEIANRSIGHALVFSTSNACTKRYRKPATKTDGSSSRSDCIPEGARIQLDPSVDVSRIAGITPGERAVATALQRYGAYVIDVGGPAPPSASRSQTAPTRTPRPASPGTSGTCRTSRGPSCGCSPPGTAPRTPSRGRLLADPVPRPPSTCTQRQTGADES